jgi:hypothetical protein
MYTRNIPLCMECGIEYRLFRENYTLWGNSSLWEHVSGATILSLETMLVLPILISCIPSALAWGTLAHETIALVAQKYVTSSTATWAQGLLNDTSSTYFANVATWADTYRYTSGGGWSAPFHFLDAEDSPPSSCNVNYNRDCGSSGCVVSAINNYVWLSRFPDLAQVLMV